MNPNRGFQDQVGVETTARKQGSSLLGHLTTLVRSAVAYPDDQKDWYKFAVEAGRDLVHEEGIDAIISSSSPVTSHLIAKQLKKECTLPWIADLRDLWTQNHYYPYGDLRRSFERRLEITTLGAADGLVTVSEPLARSLRELHPRASVFSIPNGFDDDEVRCSPLTDQFTITYTGVLYQGMRDPEPFLIALRNLISAGTMDPRVTRIRFLGPPQEWLEQEIQRYNLSGVVHQHGVLSRDNALEMQRESQVLLLLNWNHPAEAGVYTGKVFEYLAARRPIIAVGGPRSVVTELMQETGAGVHASSVEEIERALLGYYSEHESSGRVGYGGSPEQLSRYSHSEMARRFARVLDEVTSQSKTQVMHDPRLET